MKNIKIMISALILLLIILISALLFLNNSNIVQNNEEEPEDGIGEILQYENHTSKETNDNMLFALNDITQKVIDYILADNIEALYTITDISYIRENKILSNNIKDFYPKIQNYATYYIQNVYKIRNSDKVVYYTYGFILENSNVSKNYFIIELNVKDNTFSIRPIQMEEYNKAKNGEINQINMEQIVKNEYNQFKYQDSSREERARRYIKDYLFKLNYIPEVAFEHLEEQYRREKFGVVDDFKIYVQNNKNRFDSFIMKNYNSNVKENSIQYIVLDVNDNYYQIETYGPLEYNIILDNYTIETEEYIQKYNKSSEEKKVATCISKFFKFINAKEYKMAYKYLDDTFKTDKFGTIEGFEEYAKTTFLSNNILEITSGEKIGDVYSCKATIKSGETVSAIKKQLTINIILKEGTDFSMSFSIDK